MRTADQINGDPYEDYLVSHAETSAAGNRGSSAEHSLQALNLIQGVYSASQRAPPDPPKGLTLGNRDPTQTWGGEHGKTACIGNYWREVDKLTPEDPPPASVDLALLEDNTRKLYRPLSGQQLAIENKSLGSLDNLKETLFVDGDVYIRNNIINNDLAIPWNDPSEMGYLSIVARGNIYIDGSVTQSLPTNSSHTRVGSTSTGILQ